MQRVFVGWDSLFGAVAASLDVASADTAVSAALVGTPCAAAGRRRSSADIGALDNRCAGTNLVQLLLAYL